MMIVKSWPFIRALFAITLFALGFFAGKTVNVKQVLADCVEYLAVSAFNENAEIITSPTVDVPGADIADLPRYPGAVRVEYRQGTAEQLLLTEVEYVVAAPLDDVRDFYRTIFYERGWAVADLGFYQGEWTFFVIIGEREAYVEVEARGTLVEVELELSEPQTERLTEVGR